MRSKRHMTYEEMLLLYKYISLGYSLKKVVQLLGKNRSTIYRLICNYSKFENKYKLYRYSNKRTDCQNYLKCRQNGIDVCPLNCKTYKKWICSKLKNFPYICNFCEQRYMCKKEKRLFNPEQAYLDRKETSSISKSSPKISQNQLKNINEVISPLIKQGLSVETIFNCIGEQFPITSKTIRNYIDRGYLDAKRIDLINAVKREYSPIYKYKRTYGNSLQKVNRTYNDYLKFMESHDKKEVLQFDTLHGKKGDKKCILTIHHPHSKFQIGIILESFTSQAVIDAISDIRSKIGDDSYFKLFRIMLCDNGIEFDKMPSLEYDDETNQQYAKVFYTRPYTSGDKGSCERNHELFRYVIAKGKTLNDLTQENLNFIFSNINSYPRKSLQYKTPIDLMSSLYGKDLISKLNIIKVPFKQLTFKKKLK